MASRECFTVWPEADFTIGINVPITPVQAPHQGRFGARHFKRRGDLPRRWGLYQLSREFCRTALKPLGNPVKYV
jgi:hypothetical protein